MSSALITRREYSNLYRSEKTTWLLGNVNDVITFELDFEIEIKTVSSLSNPFTLETVGAQIRITRSTGSFLNDGFINGATIIINYSGTTTCVINYVSATMIIATFATTPPADGQYPDVTVPNLAISLTSATSVDGVELNYNFVKNSQLSAGTMQSMIDNTTPFFTKSGISAATLTYVDLLPIGYQSGASFLSAKIKGRGISGSVQKFTIQLIYLIPPVFTNPNDFINTVLPAPFYDIECVTDIFKIKMLPQYSNPNISISTDSFSSALLGNTGWFGENYNGNANHYSVQNVELLNSLGVPVDGIQIDGETTFNITINQTGNNALSKYKFGFMSIPSDTSIYQSNLYPNYKNLLYNGLSDSAAITYATAPGTYTGQTNSSGAQMDIQVTSMSASGNLVTIQGKFKPNATFKTYFEALTDADRKYILWISCADYTLTTELSDRVSLLLQYGEYVVPQTTFTQYDVESGFLNPAQPNSMKGALVYEGCSEDEVTANTLVRVDTSNNDVIEEVDFLIEGYNISTGETWQAERRVYNTSAFPPVSGVQQISITDNRGFDMAAGVSKNIISLERSVGDDFGTKKGYRFFYPFRLRWEYWIGNVDVDNDFFNNAERLKNFNQNWANKDFFNAWRISYALQMKINRNGTVINTKNRFQLLQRTYDESLNYNASITHYKDETAAASLYIGTVGGIRRNAILGDADTYFRCDFELSDPMGDVGDITQYFGIMRIEPFEGAGETAIMMLSTHQVNETTDNILKPLTGETGPKITKISATVIRLECWIDYTKLSITQAQYKTSARLGCAGIDLGKYDKQYSLKYD